MARELTARTPEGVRRWAKILLLPPGPPAQLTM